MALAWEQNGDALVSRPSRNDLPSPAKARSPAKGYYWITRSISAIDSEVDDRILDNDGRSP
jgi:hypothetical protein